MDTYILDLPHCLYFCHKSIWAFFIDFVSDVRRSRMGLEVRYSVGRKKSGHKGWPGMQYVCPGPSLGVRNGVGWIIAVPQALDLRPGKILGLGRV